MPILKNIEAEMGSYLNDTSRIIPSSHLETVCKKGNGASACRYICSVAQGFTCVKNTPLKATIDKEVMANPSWTAKGDNCDGFGEINSEKRSEENNKT